jgi:hypothetical protein
VTKNCHDPTAGQLPGQQNDLRTQRDRLTTTSTERANLSAKLTAAAVTLQLQKGMLHLAETAKDTLKLAISKL